MCNENIFIICVALVLVWYYFWVYKEGKNLCDMFGTSKEEPKPAACAPVVATTGNNTLAGNVTGNASVGTTSVTEGFQNDSRDFDFTEKSFSQLLGN
jgi:hypothetical protein